MYNYSGQFAFQVEYPPLLTPATHPQVGLPAKSGVSGIVLVVVPGVVGFATWSPPLDHIGGQRKNSWNRNIIYEGNSVRGVMFAEELINMYNFHRFESVIIFLSLLYNF